jgi:hypothetical protein
MLMFLLGRDGRVFLGASFSFLVPLPNSKSRDIILMRIRIAYLYAKDKRHKMLHDHVENATKLSRKAQLESYDGCARLRPVWDEIAGKYDVVFTPSVPDEAPVWIKSTGDAVSPPFLTHNDFLVFERVGLTSAVKVLLLNVDYSPSSMSQRARLFWRKWSAY